MIKYLAYTLCSITVVLFVIFIIHAIDVRNYNSEWRTITQGSTSTQVLVDIHPRGGVTDSWVKTDTGELGTNLNGKIYELLVTNNAQTNVDDWNLRININSNCFLNNGWCGTFEIHQFGDNGVELSQTVDLRNFEYDDLMIDCFQAGQDLLIPLTAGDYLVYHPDPSESSGELPIKGAADYSGTCSCGIILYNKTGDIGLNDYLLSYRLHMTVWEGVKGKFFAFSFTLLFLCFLILGTVFFISIHFEEKLHKKSKLLADVLDVCSSVADARDYYSKGHSVRVAEYSRMIAEKMGMDKNDCEMVYYAALLHNIGNAFVSEQILRKNGKLNREEFAEVKNHTKRGAELLKDLESIPLAAEAAMFHHERYDGNGYPNGIKENEIPLVARIVAVADAYDAMNNDRPYRNKLVRDRIREEFIANRGLQFDPEIVTAFLDIMGERNL